MKNIIPTLVGILCVLSVNVKSQNAPVTFAPVYITTPGQAICIPFKVIDFTDIRTISLTIDYNPAVLEFSSVYSDAIPLTWTWSGMATIPGRMIVGGYGPAFSLPQPLPDTAVLFYACFYYNGSGTPLIWYDDGTSCEYTDENMQPLNDIPQMNFYINGWVGETIIADFTVDDNTPPRNTTVMFTDLSSGDPTIWNWTFSPNTVTFVGGTSSSSQNPQVQFINGGLYTVTLTASDPYTSDIETKVGYIRAGIHGLWVGISSKNWPLSTNWDDDLTPDNLTDVLITTSTTPTYWPYFVGDLKVGPGAGYQCKSITFEGIGSELKIKGTMTVDPGGIVTATTGCETHIIFELP